MDIRWSRQFSQLLFLIVRLSIVSILVSLSFWWFAVCQGDNITGSSLSVGKLQRNIPQRELFFLEATHSNEVHLSSNSTESGNVLFTRHPKNIPRFMNSCPEGWHSEILRQANDHKHSVQLCLSGNGQWKCAPGWRNIAVYPFCVEDQLPTVHQPRYAPEYAQVSDSRKLLFIHVPKAGGTSIETSFLFQEQRQKLGGHYLGGHHKITTFDKHFFKNYYKFSIVRHPCSRLLSVWGYYSQGLGNGGDRQWSDKFLNNETKSSFEAFVKRTLYRGGPVHVDKQLHLQTQVGMLFYENGQFGLDQLLIFEKWNESIDELGKRIKVNVSVLKSTHKLSSHHKTCRESYTPETWVKMTQIYATDFCVFGYSKEFDEINITPPIDMTPETLTLRFQKCTAKTR